MGTLTEDNKVYMVTHEPSSPGAGAWFVWHKLHNVSVDGQGFASWGFTARYATEAEAKAIARSLESDAQDFSETW